MGKYHQKTGSCFKFTTHLCQRNVFRSFEGGLLVSIIFVVNKRRRLGFRRKTFFYCERLYFIGFLRDGIAPAQYLKDDETYL